MTCHTGKNFILSIYRAGNIRLEYIHLYILKHLRTCIGVAQLNTYAHVYMYTYSTIFIRHGCI